MNEMLVAFTPPRQHVVDVLLDGQTLVNGLRPAQVRLFLHQSKQCD